MVSKIKSTTDQQLNVVLKQNENVKDMTTEDFEKPFVWNGRHEDNRENLQRGGRRIG